MNNTYCVIMSGGVGSRFWPVSRESKPKQFLDFFGCGKTLLQRTFDRFARFIPTENIIVVTNDQYADETLRELPLLSPDNLLLEPVRRNTAPAITFAALHIASRCPNATIFVTPSDHMILDEDRFEELAQKALLFAQRNDFLITIGVVASHPETGYGYIQWSEETIEGFHKVKVFTEKPSREMAELFIKSGDFLWNSGMFVWNVPTILYAVQCYLPDVYNALAVKDAPYGKPEERAFIEERFAYSPGISIDYGVMEKANNVLVLPGDFGWADLGTWGSVCDFAEKDSKGNAAPVTNAVFYEAEGNLVTLSDEKRIAIVQGISDCIIAEHDNVLMICKKDQEQRIKTFMADSELRFGNEYI